MLYYWLSIPKWARIILVLGFLMVPYLGFGYLWCWMWGVNFIWQLWVFLYPQLWLLIWARSTIKPEAK